MVDVALAADADDGVQHLMWRLRHGEGIASEGPQIAVIMAGSADLTYASFKVHPVSLIQLGP